MERSRDADPLRVVLDERAKIGLEELDEFAQLQRRFDAKFLVTSDRLPQVVKGLDPSWRVLSIDGSTSTLYQSIYFDSSDLRSYRDHLQRRRRRYKIRTRVYGDSRTRGSSILEVKVKGVSGQTDKFRCEHPSPFVDELNAAAIDRISSVLGDVYNFPLSDCLMPVVTTTFRRTTLGSPLAVERMTIDQDFTVASDGRQIAFDRSVAIVETKSVRHRGCAYRNLVQIGHRPRSISKYCLAVMSVRDEVRGNPWLPTLRRLMPERAALTSDR